jgi:hypothetical protein
MKINMMVNIHIDDGQGMSDQGKGIIIGFSFAGLKMSREAIDRV